MGLSPRSLGHALRLNFDAPRLRISRTEAGERALVFDGPVARERPPLEEGVVDEPRQEPQRGRFIDDPTEVGFRHGLVRAAREGFEHFSVDEPRAGELEAAFGPLERVRIPGDEGPLERAALRLTPEVRRQVLGGRMRFAASEWRAELRVAKLDDGSDNWAVVDQTGERQSEHIFANESGARVALQNMLADLPELGNIRMRPDGDFGGREPTRLAPKRPNADPRSAIGEARAGEDRFTEAFTETLDDADRQHIRTIGMDPDQVLSDESGEAADIAARLMLDHENSPAMAGTLAHLERMSLARRATKLAVASGAARKLKGSTPEAITREIREAWGETGPRMMDAGELVVVANRKDIPRDSLMGGDIPPGVGAVHVYGTTYVIADAITPARVRSLMLHEVGVHHGLEEMIGSRRFATLLRKVEARVSERQALADRGEIDASEDIWLIAHRMAERFSYDLEDLWEETVAYAVEMAELEFRNFPEQRDRTMLQRVLDAVKRWATITLGVGEITGRDLHTLASASLQRRGRLAGRDAQEPMGAQAWIAVGEVMKFARAAGFEGPDNPRAALAFLDTKRVERGGVLGAGADYRRPGSPRGPKEAGLGEMVAGNTLAVGAAAGAGGVALTEQGREERRAEYLRLEGERAASEERFRQQQAWMAEQKRLREALAARDLLALPAMAPEGVDVEARKAYVNEQLVAWVQTMTGADPEYMRRMLARESAYTWDAAADNPHSNAFGLAQFIPLTWAGELRRVGERYGIDVAGMSLKDIMRSQPLQDLRGDARYAGAIAGEHTVENVRLLRAALGREEISRGEAYVAHFMGASRGAELIRDAAMGLPAAATKRKYQREAGSNRHVFFEGERALSAREIVQEIEREFGADAIEISSPAAPEAGSPTPESGGPEADN